MATWNRKLQKKIQIIHVKRVYFNSQTIKQRDFNSYPNVFRVRESNGAKKGTIQRKRKRENQDGGGQTGYTYNWASTLDRNAISTAKPMFSWPRNAMV